VTSSIATSLPSRPASPPSAGRHASSAFGLDLLSAFRARGLPLLERPPGPRQVQLELVDAAELARHWDRRGADRLDAFRYANGRLMMTVDAHPELGYRIAAERYGRFVVPLSGERVFCAPFRVESWGWQRLLIARVLPVVATLQGLEVLHASGVEINGGAVGVLADSGVGKSSLAVHLYLRGRSFLTDDLLSLERASDGEVVAHPGFGIVGVRPAEKQVLTSEDLRRLGSVVSRGSKSHYELQRGSRPLPLRALYLLERTLEGDEVQIDRQPAPDPLSLLASTFVRLVQTPVRLLNQLDLCSTIAAEVPVFRLAVPRGRSARETAAALDAHATTFPGMRSSS
jgi:hypothetical protein